MARAFTRASSQYLELSDVNWFAGVVSLGCWIRLASLPADTENYTIESRGGFTKGGNRSFLVRNVSGTYRLIWRQEIGLAWQEYRCDISIAAGDAHHVFYVVVVDVPGGTTTVRLWYDGVEQTVTFDGTNQGLITNTQPGETDIGKREGTALDYFDGDIAEIVITANGTSTTSGWTDEDILAMSQGYSPQFFFPTHRAFLIPGNGYYLPLLGNESDELGPFGQGTRAVVHGPTKSDWHPPMYYPAPFD